LNEGKFDARKEFYRGELMALEDISKEVEEDATSDAGEESSPHVEVVNITPN